MKVALTALFLFFLAIAGAQLAAGGTPERRELRLRYVLNEEASTAALFPRNRPPRFRRFLTGTFAVVVKERFEDGFVFQITDLQFRSVEDNLYSIEAHLGVLTFNDPDAPDPRPGLPDLSTTLSLLVNGQYDDYHPAMTGPDRELLSTTWPPVFRNLVLAGADDREPYWLHVDAVASFCPADCNQDGTSTLDELVTCLNVALGIAESGTCPTCDLNGDGNVSIDEVVTSVDTVLHGCE
jgi:hypothetical protein